MVFKLNLNNSNYYIKILYFCFAFFPITFLIGNFTINLISLIISLTFILGLFFKDFRHHLCKKTLSLLIFLLATLLINLFFSQDFYLSLPRICKFVIIIFFVLSFQQLTRSIEESYLNKIYKLWFIVFCVVVIDLLCEFVIGKNMLGQKSIIPGRLAGFSGSEMNIGHFFSIFCLTSLSFIYLNFKINYFNIFIAGLLILISFLIGERANFIRTIMVIFFFILIVYDFKFKYKIYSLSICLILFSLFINFNQEYKTRYYNSIKGLFQENGVRIYLNNSHYGAHYKVAKKIFLNYPVFGVGIKNFRVESYNKRYMGILAEGNEDVKEEDMVYKSKNWTGGTVHPHQVHYELLSETGLFGYLSFFVFILISAYFCIKSYFAKKNVYQLSGLLFVSASLIPLIPSGSFYSTYTAGLFWFAYALMMNLYSKK